MRDSALDGETECCYRALKQRDICSPPRGKNPFAPTRQKYQMIIGFLAAREADKHLSWVQSGFSTENTRFSSVCLDLLGPITHSRAWRTTQSPATLIETPTAAREHQAVSGRLAAGLLLTAPDAGLPQAGGNAEPTYLEPRSTMCLGCATRVFPSGDQHYRKGLSLRVPSYQAPKCRALFPRIVCCWATRPDLASATRE